MTYDKTAVCSRLRILLAKKYAAQWQANVEVKSHLDIHEHAVARVLTEYHNRRYGGMIGAEVKFVSIRHKVRRALHNNVLSRSTLQLFIDAFNMDTDDVRELWQLMHSRQTTPRKVLSTHDVYIIGPDGRPTQHNVTEVWQAGRHAITSCRLFFDTAIVTCEIEDGHCTEPRRIGDSTLELTINLDRPIPPDETREISYKTYLDHTEPIALQFVRSVKDCMNDVTVEVRFSPLKIPSRVNAVILGATTSRAIIDYSLPDSLIAIQRAKLLENCSIGFQWEW